MAAIGNPIGTALQVGAALLQPTQYGPVTGPGFLDPWGAAYNAGYAPIPSPVQVVTGFGNALGLPTLGGQGGMVPSFFGGGQAGPGPGAAAGIAGIAGAGAAAALLGPVAGMSPGVLILLLIVAAVVLYPLFKALLTGATSGTATLPGGGLLLILLLLGVALFAGGSGAGGSDWTMPVILLLVVLAAFSLVGNGLSNLTALLGA